MNFLQEYRGRGPRTVEGVERIVRANFKHGRRCASARREQAAFTRFVRACRATIRKVHGTEKKQSQVS